MTKELKRFEKWMAAQDIKPETLEDVRMKHIHLATICLGINIKDALGLVEHTHVVVPVEPTIEMLTAPNYSATASPRGLKHIWKAMIKAAQEDL